MSGNLYPKTEFQSDGKYRSYYPSPELVLFVKEYWTFDISGIPDDDRPELELPSLDHEIIFKFGQDYEEYYPLSDKTRIQSQSTISGTRTYAKASKRTDFGKPLSLIGIKFTPLGMYCLLNIPLIEIHDETLSLQDLNNILLFEIEERLASIRGGNIQISCLNKILLKHFQSPQIDPDVMKFYSHIAQYNQYNLSKIKQDSNYNYKMLERKFKKHIGLNPKQYYRIKRYLNFYDDWLKNNEYKYIDLVYKHNYYDQNHLIKDFQSFLGFSPNKFSSAMNSMFTQNIHLARLSV